MYNLIKFISKYKIFFLFLVLELISFGLIVQNNRYHKAGFLNSANFVTGSINSFYTSFTGYLHLKIENKLLAEENAKLKNRIINVEYTEIPIFPEDSCFINSPLAGDTILLDTTAQFNYIPALAVSKSTNKKYNYIYIDKGTKNGINKDMGILEPEGVVGVVVNSSYRYSVVMPITNEKSSLSVKIKNQGYFGTLKWNQGDYSRAKIIEVPNHVVLKAGDTIVTSGYSQIFPQGLLIGYVEKAKKIEGNSFLDIDIKLAVNFSKINYTYAIKNDELEELKNLIIE